MVFHSSDNGIINVLHAGVVIACGQRINILGICTLESRGCFTAACRQFPDNKLCSNPLLTARTLKLIFAAGLAVKHGNIDGFLLVGTHIIPHIGIVLIKLVACVQTVAGLNAVGILVIGINPAQRFAIRTDAYIAVIDVIVEGDDIISHVVAIIKGDGYRIACFGTRGDNEDSRQERDGCENNRAGSCQLCC